MVLRRLGNKKKIAHKIYSLFPAHSVYIEPFFGAGGMFFNKPRAKHNILNDNDEEVHNLFWVLQRNHSELLEIAKQAVQHESLFTHWKKNKETTPVLRAMRFLYLSNYSFMGKMDTLKIGPTHSHQIMLDAIEKTSSMLEGVVFTKGCFRDMFRKINFPEHQKIVIYCDPPYLDTDNNYQAGFCKQDVIDLFDLLQQYDYPFYYSEFNHPFIVEQAKERSLDIITIGERQSLKNRSTEIVVTNHPVWSNSLFGGGV